MLDKSYYYIPGTILHLDSDHNFINECEKYYKSNNIKAYLYLDKEENYKNIVLDLIKKVKPDIIIITGHDAKYNKEKDGKLYKNSKHFIETVEKIRSFNSDIIIFAGACQSDFKSIIKSGANYASSPSNINIHALDPSIIASEVALTDINRIVDIDNSIKKTFCGYDGIGGVISKGKMKTVFPRKE